MRLRQLPGLANEPLALTFLQAAPFWADHWPRNQELYQSWLARNQDWWLLSDETGAWQWLSALHKLEFDSQIFGATMGWLNPLIHGAAWPGAVELAQGRDFVRQMQALAQQKGLEFLMARVGSRDILAGQCLEAAGFCLMDNSVEWLLDLTGLPPLTLRPGLEATPWQDRDRAALLDLASRAFSYLPAYADRFTLDPRLRHGSGRLYAAWLDNSLKGQQADEVLVLRRAGQVLGFISLRLPSGPKGLPGADCAWVALNALDEPARGQGLYNYMLLHGLHWLKQQGAPQARIRTKVSQNAVINAWSRLGARQVWADMSFHWWHGGE